MPDKSSHGYYIALEEITGKPASVADLLKELSKIAAWTSSSASPESQS